MTSKILIVMCCLLGSPAWAGSSVGHGGDVVQEFLEATRSALRESMRVIEKNPKEVQKICAKLPQLSEAQRQQCQDFVRATVSQYISLNQGNTPTVLVLQADPLYVKNPDGTTRQVQAMTQLGAGGSIYFHFDSVKYLSPVQMLALLGHEFGHKVTYKDHVVEDDPTEGAFASGRQFLDTIGAALADYAADSGFISAKFNIKDYFACEMSPGPGQLATEVEAPTPRHFANSTDFDNYQVTIGERPSDMSLSIADTPTTHLNLHVIIQESAGCSTTAPKSARSTQISIVRTYQKVTQSEPSPDETVAEQTLDGFNPLCTKENKFQIAYKGISFACSYAGSQGVTGFR